jgi:excisionase family DNA binding protein
MTAQTTGRVPITPQLYRIPDVVPILRLSRSVIYELIRSGRLRTVRQGSARRVPASAIAEYVALLEDEAAQEASR